MVPAQKIHSLIVGKRYIHLTIPKITVVIPVFNAEKTLDRALNSVAAQTYPDFDVVVVDDGSTDKTVDLVSNSRIGNLTFVKHAQNRGAAAARNTGISAARGRFIAFLDADDAWKPNKLERQIAALERAGSNVVACATGYHLHKGDRDLTIALNLTSEQFRKQILFGCTISPGTTLLIDRRAFDGIGLFDETFRRLEDWDWLLRFAERFELEIISEPLADIYLAVQILSYEQRNLILDAIKRTREKHLHRFGGLARVQLRSSLLIERAAMLYRSGKPIFAAMYVLAAIFVYPRRNAAFYRTLWRSVGDVIWSGG